MVELPQFNSENGEDELHHECFVSAVIDPSGNALEKIVPLSMDQRGRANIGTGVSFISNLLDPIVTEKASVTPREFFTHFNKERPAVGAIAHGRYRTYDINGAEGNIKHVHPFYVRTRAGFELAYAMNGNTTNGEKLQSELNSMGLHIPVEDFTDSRTNAVYIAHSPGETEIDKFKHAFNRIQGSHSDVILTKTGVTGVRDRMGNRPIVLGSNGQGAYAFASESAALEAIDFFTVKDVEPGTFIHIDWEGKIEEVRYAKSNMLAYCAEEPAYFANRHSFFDERRMFEIRKQYGHRLGELEDVVKRGENYIVAGLPKTGIDAANGYAEAMGFPYMRLYDIVDPEIRSFLQEASGQEAAAKKKLRINEKVFNQILEMGSGIIVVDDTIIRGNMFRSRAEELAELGITNVHGRAAADIHGHGCPWGIAMEESQMIYRRCGNNPDLIAKELGLESIRFLPYEEEAKILLGSSFDERMELAQINVKAQYERSGAHMDQESMKVLAYASLGLCFGCRARNGLFQPYSVNAQGSPNIFSPAEELAVGSEL